MCGGRQRGVTDDEAEVVSGLVWRDLGPMIMYDLSQFGLRQLACIHNLISKRQLVGVD